jgi:crossover junction endodeoxyribonuclease RuvC
MIFLGIDPGTAVTGYGVILARNNSVSRVDLGVIVTEPRSPLPERLMKIYDGLKGCIDRHKPQRVSIEQAFYAKNVHTTLLLGHARGVAMLAARQSGAEIAEYSPREIKKATTGNGNATKEQVEYMVKMLLPGTPGEQRSDAWDALAVALCDFYNGGTRSMVAAAPGGARTMNFGLKREVP